MVRMWSGEMFANENKGFNGVLTLATVLASNLIVSQPK